MRKIGLDIGDKRIGVAVSDLSGTIANSRETYNRRSTGLDMQYFYDIAVREGADAFVLGLPINMDGTRGERVEICEEFGRKLGEKTGLPIFFQDERLTTVYAERMLIEADVRRDKRKQVIDKVAACIILQSFLDSKANK
ncbi:MAG TPA: Holliday junction resolvase RuvX [Clostridia bacterium]|nr:Holliday junction resolvase RuvX [Clostridia bacterium]